MTLDEDMRIVYSDRVRECMDEDVFESFFGKSDHVRIRRPSRYKFDDSFIDYHRKRAYEIWKGESA